ncbi:hypothetical protein GCM10010358_33100 [Streptomyces minutiscleroticus]|uniref:Uncharacterized protein n=1 Tax=Streptomyces minutiscleroticus TaxID=68238 RepID=A0A918KTZ9_9ACTN|nr:hypothetical protein [Streptomyces minutiscleroticus]GGX76073.1 hypothetical protein GCM10010358_33100 [Streptomyces minutiscleroticus]
MGRMGEVWCVRSGDVPVGEIAIDGGDFPWLAGRFTAGPGFAAVAPLFARDIELTELDDDARWDEWEQVHEEIRRTVSLSSPAGPVPEFLLHVEGDRARFRWSDEPFAAD